MSGWLQAVLTLKLDRVPGLLWDPRIALFRAPAWRYTEVLDALRRLPSALRDEVRPHALHKPAAYNAVDLTVSAGGAALLGALGLSWDDRAPDR